MSVLELLLAVAGVGVTLLVSAGMILLTPRGVVPVHAEGTDPQGSNLSPTRTPEQPPAVAAARGTSPRPADPARVLLERSTP